MVIPSIIIVTCNSPLGTGITTGGALTVQAALKAGGGSNLVTIPISMVYLTDAVLQGDHGTGGKILTTWDGDSKRECCWDKRTCTAGIHERWQFCHQHAGQHRDRLS